MKKLFQNILDFLGRWIPIIVTLVIVAVSVIAGTSVGLTILGVIIFWALIIIALFGFDDIKIQYGLFFIAICSLIAIWMGYI